jgi:hypothetical protein
MAALKANSTKVAIRCPTVAVSLGYKWLLKESTSKVNLLSKLQV